MKDRTKKRGIIIEKYLSKYWKENSTSIRGLSRILADKYPDLWNNKGMARSSLRSFLLKDVNHSKFGIKSEYSLDKRKANLFSYIPRPDYTIIKPIVISNGLGMIISDAHMPYHDRSFLNFALNKAKNIGIKWLLLNGDWIDSYHLSKFLKDPRKKRFPEEIEMVRQFLVDLRHSFSDIDIYYKFGNHEERYRKHLFLKAPELIGLNEFELDVLLGFNESNIIKIELLQEVKYNKFLILHGHEILRRGSTDPAKTLYRKNHRNIIMGHVHKTQDIYRVDIATKKLFSLHTVGCACKLSPDFMPYNEWNNGFLIIEKNQIDNCYVHNEKIIST